MTDLVTRTNRNGQCPGCGQGFGKPHYERCSAPVPGFGGSLSAGETGALAAYALAVFPLDEVRRSTIRAMLPRGRTARHQTPSQRSGSKGHHNVTSKHFRDEMVKLEGRGWVARAGEHVIVIDRGALLENARLRLAKRPHLIAALHKSLGAVAAELRGETAPATQAQRLAELRAIKRLMEESPATGPHQGRGYVTLTSKPALL